jgi:hypothetical protein
LDVTLLKKLWAGHVLNLKLGVTLLLAAMALTLPANLQPLKAQAKLDGITLTPFSQNITVNPDKPVTEFEFFITNNTKLRQSLFLSAVDFGNLDDTGGLIFAGTNNKLVNKYGLSNWLTLNQEQVVVKPGERIKVAGNIRNEPSLSPGGHYGAVLASTQPSSQQASNSVALKQTITTLVLATKTGGERYDMKLNSASIGGNFFGLPSRVTLDFQNTGNVHIIPRGSVTVLKEGSTVIRQGAINEDSNIVLPEISRNIYAYPHKTGSTSWLPINSYVLKIDYRYEGLDGFASKSFTIWRANPITFFLLVLVALGLGYLAFRHVAAPQSKKQN